MRTRFIKPECKNRMVIRGPFTEDTVTVSKYIVSAGYRNTSQKGKCYAENVLSHWNIILFHSNGLFYRSALEDVCLVELAPSYGRCHHGAVEDTTLVLN